MAISAQELNIILTARDKQFQKAMTAAEAKVGKFSKNSEAKLSKVSQSFNALGRAARAAGLALAAAFAVKALLNMTNSAVELGNLAAVAGVSVERFQELAFAGAAFGVSQEKMADILKDVNDKFGDYLTTGAGPLADFFENIAPKIGLTTKAFEGLSSDQKMGKYIQALQLANLSQDRMTFFMEALASDSTLLIGAFKDGGAELDRLSGKLRNAGGVMSSEMIEKSRALQEELRLVSSIINSNLSAALEVVLPLVSALANGFNDVTTAIGDYSRAMAKDLGASAEAVQIKIDSINARFAAGKLSLEQQKRLLARQEAILVRIRSLQDSSPDPEPPVIPPATAPAVKPTGGPTDAKTREAAEKARKKAEDELAKAQADEKQRLESVQAAYDGVRGSLEPLYAATQDYAKSIEEVNAALADGFISEKQAAIDRDGILKRFQKARDEATGLVKVRDAYDDIRSSLDPLRDATLAYAKSIEAVNDALDRGLISEDQAAIDRERLVQNFQAIKDEASGLTESLDVVGDAFATAFGDIISGTTSVSDAFKRMAASIITDLIKIEIQQAQKSGGGGSGLAGLGKSLFSGLAGLLGGGAVGGAANGPGTANSFDDAFSSYVPSANGNASGGAMAAGSPAVVGEHGREIFVPSSAGRMLSVPQSKAAVNGGGGATVNQTINVTTGIQQTVRAEIQSLMPQIAAASTQAVLNARRRGGSFARSFS